MHVLITGIVSMLIKYFTAGALDAAEVDRVKNFIISLEDKAIDSSVKHQQTADLIKSMAGDLTSTTVDLVIKLLLSVVRAPV
jgi:hypothetical protein